MKRIALIGLGCQWAAMKEREPQAKAREDPMVGADLGRIVTTRFDYGQESEPGPGRGDRGRDGSAKPGSWKPTRTGTHLSS